MNYRPTLRELVLCKKKLKRAIAHWGGRVKEGEDTKESRNLTACVEDMNKLDKYVRGVYMFPNRNTMTKKKQRALGILPSVT